MIGDAGCLGHALHSLTLSVAIPIGRLRHGGVKCAGWCSFETRSL
jgi:hypothetical protein